MNFLRFKNFKLKDYKEIFKLADKFLNKKKLVFKRKRMIMLFDKPSTRTRVSFEMGFKEEGGSVVFLDKNSTQISRGESLKDSAKILSSFCDILVIRTFEQKDIEEFAKNSSVPVINALTNKYHPCQITSDIYTFIKKRKTIFGKIVTWVGDYNNVFKTWIEASKIFGFELRAVLPKNIKIKKKFKLFNSIDKSIINSDLLVTDTWFSMGESKKNKKASLFSNLKIKNKDLDLMKKGSLFFHCLPAYEGNEIEKGVLDHKKSTVWEAAFNKSCVQKAIIKYLITTH